MQFNMMKKKAIAFGIALWKFICRSTVGHRLCLRVSYTNERTRAHAHSHTTKSRTRVSRMTAHGDINGVLSFGPNAFALY